MTDLPDGIYEQVIHEAIARFVSESDSSIEKETIKADSSPDIFARYMQKAILFGLTRVRENARRESKSQDEDGSDIEYQVRAQIEACNTLIESLSAISKSNEVLDFRIGKSGERLLSVWNKNKTKDSQTIRPKTSISISRLFTGGKGIQLSDELNREIRSSNKVDFLVSFIKNSGINTIRSSLEEFTKSGGKLRILTTTYMGNTEPNILRTLARLPNTEVRISYDSNNTRLHAKSYIFERDNGFSTVYIGSSNLSRAAVTDGMEWNVKLTNQDAPQVIQEVKSTFEIYWNSKDFKPFDPEKDYEELRRIIAKEKNRDVKTDDVVFFDICPHPYQEELLQELQAQREVHNNYRNLVVAATGTGKTIVSAFDYKRFCQSNPGKKNTLLFIAHREEILNQSMKKFQAVLRDQNFGEKFVGGSTPTSYDHLFMSIQTFNSRNFSSLPPDYYDFIIVDEVHHGCANSYQDVLTHFTPKILLGLTATPDRMDGLDIRKYFGNVVSCEIRLTEAINRELLVPFQYYAISDPVDISKVSFARGRYDEEELGNLYTGNDERIQVIWEAIERYQPDIPNIKCIGFCANIRHAEYMAERFNEKGLKAIALTSHTENKVREEAQQKLAKGELQFIFTVDLYNEGVDIPEVNTELMLRPTESKTVFVQQLGRGLRKSSGKSELIVLDFVGQFDKKYKVYEQKLRVMTAACGLSVAAQIKSGFQGLPLGCYIELEKVAKERILNNIDKESGGKKDLMNKIREYRTDHSSTPTLEDLIREYELNPKDVYFRKCTVAGLCREIWSSEYSFPDGEITPSAMLRICNIDSRRWIKALKRFLTTGEHDDGNDVLYATMFYYTLRSSALPEKYDDIWAFIDQVRSEKELCTELLQILDYNYSKIDFIDESVDLGYENVLDLHCSYTKDQILAALGKSTAKKMYPWREGVLYLKDKGVPTDLFLININKDESDYSPSTMYEDYPISSELFHWQTQSIVSETSTDGKRYINRNELGTNTLLFVREKKSGKYGTPPYVFLGKASYVSHEGSKPMSIVWKMEKEIPAKVMAWSLLDKG